LSSVEVVRKVTSFPWSDFFGMMYSDIGANSSNVGPVEVRPVDEEDAEEEPDERDREAGRDD
jgi:hypothetical protein